MPSTDDLKKAALAAAYADKCTPHGSCNIPNCAPVDKAAENSRKLIELVQGWLAADERATLTAAIATRNKMGNCEELAYCAYYWLRQRGVLDVALVSVPMRGLDDHHMFVIIGTLYKNEKLQMDELCGREEIVICDAWAARFLAAQKRPHPGAFTGPDYLSILAETKISDDDAEVTIELRPHVPLPLRRRTSVVEIEMTTLPPRKPSIA